MLSRVSVQHGLVRRVALVRLPCGITTRQPLAVVRLNIGRRWQSSTPNKTVGVGSGDGNQSKNKWERWRQNLKRLAIFIKMLRIPALGLSVYALGRQQGIIECSRNPRLIEDELLQTILADVGVKDRRQVHIFTSQDSPVVASTTKGILQAKILRVGNNIIRAASVFVREEIVKSIKTLKEKLPSDISNDGFMLACKKDENFVFWTTALYRVEGEDPSIPWRYLLIESPIANAFVTEILPQRFFITTSMFNHYIDSDDELAVILGHEMSHLILGHVSQRNSLETALRTVEVLLLSLDPTEGAASLAVIAGLAWLRGILVASFSREHETEADELGVMLAARACYNTQLGSMVMKKMHDHQAGLAGEPTSNSHLLHLLDTHPPSLDRYNKIVKQSETENPRKYDSNCATIQQRMIEAVFGRPK